MSFVRRRGLAGAGPKKRLRFPKTFILIFGSDRRRWWDFGGGTLGDMGCHYIDLAHWALKLRHPLTIEAEGPPVHPETTPAWLIVRYQYPARGEMPPVHLSWYD